MTVDLRSLSELSQDDIDLLKQAFVRLKSTGLMLDIINWSDFFDAVVARGEYANTDDDYLYEEEL